MFPADSALKKSKFLAFISDIAGCIASLKKPGGSLNVLYGRNRSVVRRQDRASTPRVLRPYARNARRHSKKQIRQIADSIQRFGFTNPVLVSDDGEIIAGHGRVEAAKLLGLDQVPTLRLSHLSATERGAYVLADNKLALNAGWDQEMLAIELQTLIDLDFDVTLTGFPWQRST